ncbi:hypothetical protein BH11MYX1_BH11MYX1_32460 [soil metagenome]
MSNFKRDLLHLTMVAMAAFAVAGCHGTNETQVDAALDAPPPAGTPFTCIKDNHTHAPHKLAITAEDVTAGTAKTYSIQGMANHDHMVTISAAQFTMLQAAAGGSPASFTVTSTLTLDHMHDVTISSAAITCL